MADLLVTATAITSAPLALGASIIGAISFPLPYSPVNPVTGTIVVSGDVTFPFSTSTAAAFYQYWS